MTKFCLTIIFLGVILSSTSAQSVSKRDKKYIPTCYYTFPKSHIWVYNDANLVVENGNLFKGTLVSDIVLSPFGWGLNQNVTCQRNTEVTFASCSEGSHDGYRSVPKAAWGSLLLCTTAYDLTTNNFEFDENRLSPTSITIPSGSKIRFTTNFKFKKAIIVDIELSRSANLLGSNFKKGDHVSLYQGKAMTN